ncbi:MAG: hypothetical protein CMP23_04350 [Rickettsiales bacterium]|nr:hypothetical protein [Rickettsiales bacterium]
MILPALFVGGLFYVTFTRTPQAPQQLVIQGEALGTSWVVKSAEPATDESKQELRAIVQSALDEVDAQMSTYRSDSELMKLNGHKSLDGTVLSQPLVEILSEALEIGRLSEGAFDVTIGPAVRAWGFGPEKLHRSPAADTIERLAPQLGQDKLRLEQGKAYKAHPELEVDLSAIAKGHAVDLVIERLTKTGRQNLLAEVGGEIVARGNNPRGEPWRLGIEAPNDEQRSVHQVVALKNAAMATSGDYRNYYEVDGSRVSHLIDPRSLQPVTNQLASVTVIATRCSTADAWATALSILGLAAGLEIAERLSLAALFIVRDPELGFVTKTSTAFQQLE